MVLVAVKWGKAEFLFANNGLVICDSFWVSCRFPPQVDENEERWCFESREADFSHCGSVESVGETYLSDHTASPSAALQ